MNKLGAHPMTLDGVPGVAFIVFAPNARRVQRGRRLQTSGMRGVTRMRVARQRLLGVVRAACHPPATIYKFDIIGPQGQHLPLKSRSDGVLPRRLRPSTASIVSR